ncbi:MAG: hypothetical protein WDM78_17970 [Puia sp.]
MYPRECREAFSDSFSASLRNQYPGLIRSIDEKVSDSLAPQLIQIVTDHLPVFLEPQIMHTWTVWMIPEW